MNKILLLGTLAIGSLSFAQSTPTTLFLDDFNGGSSNWILNSTDLNSTSNKNQWIVNGNYVGGNIPSTCYMNGSISSPTTPTQPQGITSPNGNYLHLISNAALSTGILNNNFESGNIDCPNTEETFVKMSSPISTMGVSNVAFSFWVLKGQSDAGYKGTAYYSIDGGSSWVAFINDINNYTSWTKITRTNTIWDNQSSLLFAFSFKNSTSWGTGLYPMAIDDVKIEGDQAPVSILTITNPSTIQLCAGNSTTTTLELNSNYTPTSGNNYQIYLSDALGSFSTELLVGSTASLSSGIISINCTLPSTLVAGNGYRFRGKSTAPALISDTTSYSFSIHAPATITIDTDSDGVTICEGQSLTLAAEGAGNLTWNNGTTGAVLEVTPEENTTYTVSGIDANECPTSAQISIEVEECLSLGTMPFSEVQIFPNPVINEMSLSNMEGLKQVQILDLTGRVIKVLEADLGIWSLVDLSKGTYILNLKKENSTSNITFIKQ